MCCAIRTPPPPPPPAPTPAPTRPPPPPPPPQPRPTPCLDSRSICVAPYQCNRGAVQRNNGVASKPFVSTNLCNYKLLHIIYFVCFYFTLTKKKTIGNYFEEKKNYFPKARGKFARKSKAIKQ